VHKQHTWTPHTHTDTHSLSFFKQGSSTYDHCVSKNDTDVAYYNFHVHQPIFVIFGRDVAERVWICYSTSPN